MCCDGAERGSEQLIDKLKCLHVKLGQCRPLASAVLRCSPLIQTQTLSYVCVRVQTKQQILVPIVRVHITRAQSICSTLPYQDWKLCLYSGCSELN